MGEFKVVIGTKAGKTYQKVVKSPEADTLLKKHLGDTVAGEEIGFPGYEFQVTGGSDKCGFPMRAGIQQARKRVLISGGVGFSGKNRHGVKQKGIFQRTTICGEMITKIIHQVNLKALKEGPQALAEVAAPVESKKE